MQLTVHVRAPGPALLEAVPVCYHVFDLLHLDGESMLGPPYRDRRDLLAGLGLVDGIIDAPVRVPPHYVDTDGRQLLAVAEAGRLEGAL